MNRRQFLAASAAAGAAALAPRALRAQSGQPLLAKPVELSPFDYGDVEIADGPLKRQFDDTRFLFLGLSNDRLLKVYRERSNMPAPGEDMGGWYDNHAFAPGHAFGQYVSGLARAYAATGEPAMRDKVHQLIDGYAPTLNAQGTFFIDIRFPAYTYDKLALGLLDAHRYTAYPGAMDLHKKLTHVALQHMPAGGYSRAEQRARPHKDISYTWDEPYTLPENLYLAYQISGNSYYRDLGTRYLDDDDWFGPLAAGQNVLPGKHAYSHMNSLSSAMQSWFTTGSEMHLRAARNAFAMVRAQSFVTGGWGPSEAFVEPGKGQLAASLGKTNASFETPCGSYAHFKITRYLLTQSRDSTYGDSMERVLYNTILGAKTLEPDGSTFYYSDYQPNGNKFYHKDKWPCCSGTLPQVAADYHISIYFRSPEGVYVNLYTPSTLRWKHGATACTLTQRTAYPHDGRISLDFASSHPVHQTIYLRIPKWAGAKARLSINGEPQSGVQAGQFFAAVRRWKSGDRIQLDLPMQPRLEAVDDQHPDQAAVFSGPLVLFAVSDTPRHYDRDALLHARSLGNPKGDWLTKSGDGATVVLRPFTGIEDERYSTYLQLKS